MKTSLLALAAFALSGAAHAATPLLAEDFNNISTLSTWVMNNQSAPPGNAWFQGNAGIFSAQAGAANAYIAANFLSAAGGAGTVDNWLITPALTLTGPTSLTFYTRGDPAPGFADYLEVRYSPSGGAAPADFSTVLATIGGSYPSSWQQVTANLNAVGSGRFAFRYTGPAASLNYIGIDTVRVNAVPEPSSWAMLCAGLLLLRRKRWWAALGAGALSLSAMAAEPQPGMVVVRDAQTGQFRAPAAQEHQALVAQAKALAPPTAPQAQTITRPDGTRARRLDPSTMVFAIVTRGADGKLEQHCVSSAEAADAALKQAGGDHHEDR